MTYEWISLSYATFVLGTRDGRVVEAPPIARWTMGKDVNYVLGYFFKKERETARFATFTV